MNKKALIRRSLWIDNRSAEVLFGVFVHDWYDAIKPRLELGTAHKYLSHINKHLLLRWQAWPLISIFNSYMEIEKWVTELHGDYADSTVSSVFSTFSTVMSAAVRARMIPSNPCAGIRVTSGEFETDKLVASPVQVLRAAMRLYRSGLGLGGFVLCVMDAYTGGRWGELAGQQRHEYDRDRRAIAIWQPLKEVSGKLFKAAWKSSPTGVVSRPCRRVGPRRRRAARRLLPGRGGWSCRPEWRCCMRSCWTAISTLLCCARRRACRGGDRTFGSGSGGRRGTGITRTSPTLRITFRRSCAGSPSTRDGTLTQPGSPRTASRRSLGVRGWGRR